MKPHRQSQVVYDLVQSKIKHKKRQRHHSDRFNPKVAKLDVEWKDNQGGTLPKLLKLNDALRTAEWPYPFNNTACRTREADARNLEWIPSRPQAEGQVLQSHNQLSAQLTYAASIRCRIERPRLRCSRQGGRPPRGCIKRR